MVPSIDQYLNLQNYYPISSDEFMEKFNIKADANDPEISKTISIKRFCR